MKVCRLQALMALIPLGAGLFAVPAMAADGETKKIRRLGNPATTISSKDTTTNAELKERVREYRDSLSVILAQSTFDGDPQDFFDAVENGDFERTSVPVGATFSWMSYRKDGQPALVHNVEWAGKAPFEAWRVTVESKGATSTFIIPGTCLNLALENRAARGALSCTLNARAGDSTFDRLGAVTVSGRATPSGDLTITGIGGPTTVIDSGQARSAGAGRWTFQPSKPGRYRFDAQVRDAFGREATCQAEARVAPFKERPKPQPVCRLTGSYDEATGIITLDGSGTEGDMTITDATAPDGSAVTPAGDGRRWTIAVDKRTKRRGGEYVVRSEARIEDRVSQCTDVRVVVPERARAGHGWILRAFGFAGEGDDQVRFTRIGPAGGLERHALEASAPDGLGVGLEFLATSRIGIEGALLSGEIDGAHSVDLNASSLGRDTDDIPFTAVTLGVNFHLTPDRRADIYVGPLLGFVQYGDGHFDLPDRWTTFEFDDDVGVGAQIGVDIPLRRDGRWGFNSALRYLQSTAEDDRFGEDVQLDLDPLLFSAGISFRF